MAEGYEDIDKYVANYNQMLDKSLQQQNDIVNKQTQMQVDSLGRQKEQIDREATQQNRAIYQDYKKNSNPFGQQAESLAGQGLANSGYAETTQARMYNTYQNNITATLNNARQLKADVDFQIQQARQTGDITLAQNALQLFNQRMQLLSQEYDMRNNREQFLYQKQQDALAQSNWQKEYDYQLSKDKKEDKWRQKEWNYKVKQDKNEEKWRQKEWDYTTSKKARASSSRSSGGSRRSYSTRKSSSGTTGSSINTDDGTLSKQAQNVMNNVTDILKGVAKEGTTVGSIIANLKKGNVSEALKTVKSKASNSIYNAWKNNIITDEEADAITKKLGL